MPGKTHKNEYTEGIGRRKTASARVRITPAKHSSMVVNGKTAEEYFPLAAMVKTAYAPIQLLGTTYAVSVKVQGGGHKAQAEAVRHGLSRAIVTSDEEFKKRLRGLGFLTRDSRMVERKKYGLKKARRAPQWKKR